jgi:hypothetical protein
MEYVALVVGLLGLVMAWNAGRKNKELNERITQTNSRIYNLRRELEERQEKAQHELTALKVEIIKLKGELAITPETRIGELPLMHPQALQVLAGFHLGGCASCSVDEGQTLGEAAAVNGREIEPILLALNTLITQDNNGSGQLGPERLKMPNIQLHF